MKTVNELSNKAKRDEAIDKASDKLTKFKGDFESAAHDAGVSLKEYYERKRSELEQIADDYSDTVRAKPIQTSLLALGVGYLIGRLLSR